MTNESDVNEVFAVVLTHQDIVNSVHRVGFRFDSRVKPADGRISVIIFPSSPLIAVCCSVKEFSKPVT